jgi:hypothetical protein
MASREIDRAKVETVLAGVEAEYGLRRGALRTRERKPPLDEAKGVAAFLARVNTELGWLTLGQELGKRVNVRTLVMSTMERLQRDEPFARRVQALEVKLELKPAVYDVLRGEF